MIDHSRSRAFKMHEDFILICNWSHPQAAVLEVLTEASDERIRQLGYTPETVDPQFLWLSLSYHDFYERVVGFTLYALRKALDDLEKRGWVEVRYVRQNGGLIVYQSNAQAQSDKEHDGPITKQYRFRFDLVQQAIDAKFNPEGGNAARGGKPRASNATPSDYPHHTTDPHTNSTGGIE